MKKRQKATDCACTDCGKRAAAFWPVCDPDIPSSPYCRQCLDARKFRVMAALFDEMNRDGNEQ